MLGCVMLYLLYNMRVICKKLISVFPPKTYDCINLFFILCVQAARADEGEERREPCEPAVLVPWHRWDPDWGHLRAKLWLEDVWCPWDGLWQRYSKAASAAIPIIQWLYSIQYPILTSHKRNVFSTKLLFFVVFWYGAVNYVIGSRKEPIAVFP